MAKKFERAEIICNDDDTYTVEIFPVREEKEGDEYSPLKVKRMTADTLEAVIAKIQNMADGSDGKKASDMNKYLSGEMDESETEDKE